MRLKGKAALITGSGRGIGGKALPATTDVAGAVFFLASDLSGGMSGQMLTIRNSNRW